jgi:undecaprenyl-diphosphatase
MPNFLRNQVTRIRAWQWKEVAMLIAALVVLICIYSVIELTDEVKEGETRKVDEWILLNLRRADDPAVPIGPAWLREAGLDLTALGGAVVLVLMVSAVVGFMWLQRRYGLVLFTVLTIITGAGVAALLKYAIARDRPDVVPHLREVTTPSFPSGHAMLSAIVYLTLGTLLMQVVPGRRAKLYCLTIAMLLTFLVGVSRIYLGVHYPTDVLAGWMAGVAWALGCWMAARYFRHWFVSRRELPETSGEDQL